LPGDVAEPGEWLAPAIDRGILHTLVHNAGYDVVTRVGETDLAVFERLMRVQVSGPFEITQRLLGPLTEANGAAVIHIASVHAQATNPDTSAYAAAKGALVAMVKSMAQDLGASKIRALTVSPGFIDTHLFEAYVQSSEDPEATKAFAYGLHPLGRIGTPKDVGDLVVFLASTYAEFINATNVVVDGGLSARLF
jgi:meso-butanediol dehydrogenase/(S,S)-butanediol dehydrogenase/diacetyl reductase